MYIHDICIYVCVYIPICTRVYIVEWLRTAITTSFNGEEPIRRHDLINRRDTRTERYDWISRFSSTIGAQWYIFIWQFFIYCRTNFDFLSRICGRQVTRGKNHQCIINDRATCYSWMYNDSFLVILLSLRLSRLVVCRDSSSLVSLCIPLVRFLRLNLAYRYWQCCNPSGAVINVRNYAGATERIIFLWNKILY